MPRVEYARNNMHQTISIKICWKLINGKNIQILLYVVSIRRPIIIGLTAAAFPLQRWHLDTYEDHWPKVWLLQIMQFQWRLVNQSPSTKQFNDIHLQISDYIDTQTRKIILSKQYGHWIGNKKCLIFLVRCATIHGLCSYRTKRSCTYHSSWWYPS